LKILVSSIQGSKFQSLTLVVLLISFVTFTLNASLILELEKDYSGGINTANEALKWAFVNVMNAKISIIQAQSATGMVISVILNKVGALLFAYFNAIIVAWLIQKRVATKPSGLIGNKR